MLCSPIDAQLYRTGHNRCVTRLEGVDNLRVALFHQLAIQGAVRRSQPTASTTAPKSGHRAFSDSCWGALQTVYLQSKGGSSVSYGGSLLMR